MTEKIYDENPRQTEFTATVLSCEYNEKRKLHQVILDRTAFFPEEGGQMPDRGTLAGQPVLDVRLRKETAGDSYEETILHLVREMIPVGRVVTGVIDWGHRFDQMQQHSGEHLVSGLVNRHYGYDNVGFHLGAEEVTLDFNGPLTLAQMREIEEEANGAVKANFPVAVDFPAPEILREMNYRSKIELKGPVRIVTFPGYDVCACCAPHVERTGEIGMVKVTGVQAYKGGVRVNILCGDRARRDYTKKQDSVTEISHLTSSKPDLVVEGVERLQREIARQNELVVSLQAQLMEVKMAALPAPEETENVVLVTETLDPIAARNTANTLADTYAGFGAVLVGKDSEGYRFIVASRHRDCRELAGRMRAEFGAKGGGSAEMIQGTVQVEAERFCRWMSESHD